MTICQTAWGLKPGKQRCITLSFGYDGNTKWALYELIYVLVRIYICRMMYMLKQCYSKIKEMLLNPDSVQRCLNLNIYLICAIICHNWDHKPSKDVEAKPPIPYFLFEIENPFFLLSIIKLAKILTWVENH